MSDPYKQFFDGIWEAYCALSISDVDDAELVRELGMRCGLVVGEKYDERIHGEGIGSEWGLENGDPIYFARKPTQAAASDPLPAAQDAARGAETLLARIEELESSVAPVTLLVLRRGRLCQIDTEDIEKVRGYTWLVNKRGYITATVEDDRKIAMHRLITDCPAGKVVDHINGDRLDNRKANLRVCGDRENQQNSRPKANSSSRYKGVSFHKATGKWQASIKDDGRIRYLGLFTVESEAAAAYDVAAQSAFGEFALTNAAYFARDEHPGATATLLSRVRHDVARQNALAAGSTLDGVVT